MNNIDDANAAKRSPHVLLVKINADEKSVFYFIGVIQAEERSTSTKPVDRIKVVI